MSSFLSAPSAGILIAADVSKAYFVLTAAVSAAVLISIAAMHLAGVFKACDYAARVDINSKDPAEKHGGGCVVVRVADCCESRRAICLFT